VPLTKEGYVRGAGKGKWAGVEHILDTPMPEDVLEAFYGVSVPGNGKAPMTRLLLDAHTLVWWDSDSNALGEKASRVIQDVRARCM
jgi:hypothetical protein